MNFKHTKGSNVLGYAAHDITDKFGRLLLAKGTLLTPSVIEKLELRGISFEILPAQLKKHSIVSGNHLLQGHDPRFRVPAKLDPKFQRLDMEVVGPASKYLNKFLKEIQEDPFLSNNIKVLAQGRRVTYSHSINVALLSISIAKKLKFDEAALRDLTLGALFHDIGKILLPKSVLNEEEEISAGGEMIFQQHPVLGGELLAGDMLPPSIYLVAQQHHEKYAGDGYPQGLAGEEIHRNTVIVSVANDFDKLTTATTQREVLLPDEALVHILQYKEIDYHPLVVDEFSKLFI
ncbi:hypothetical protein P22_0749 [Propionispora sp. 2/2-37]|uniref:HD-GYP domain-containing protein n=1 Tax=Propionispora sp. 2/2-37 TaxID=1677858 RepID=UPI0006BB82A8|nr:HD domain-containing phosphohydrolase [Propionispora sp. 2/2-37]CUH94683.1 hypothetical protein P22_0749 [Propionispora sp. 2/2-37]